jgi:pyruvate formate lyase activating enzyme
MREKGYIFDIKKFSIHDGPGIRTTVFFKGCPLNCWWCHNPESQKIEPEEFLGCTFRWSMSHSPSDRNIIGKEVFTDEVMFEIEKDIPFYEESNGGATFSGGEPMLQTDFLFSLLTGCKAKDISTAIDTTGHVPFKYLEKVYNTTDIFLYDLKLMDEQKHVRYTGVSNKIIFENLERLTSNGKKVILRIPIIPGITDTNENIDQTIDYISSLKNISEVDLLPFHKTANSKYERMKKENKLHDIESPEKEQLNKLKDRFSSLGCTVKIGG